MPRKPMEVLTESMFYVLMALYSEEMCGIDVAEYIDKRTGGRLRIGPATLYTILVKFEKEKYIRQTVIEGRKRTYSITEKGINAYLAEINRLRQCIADADSADAQQKEK